MTPIILVCLIVVALLIVGAVVMLGLALASKRNPPSR
jgi:hypothetical protein